MSFYSLHTCFDYFLDLTVAVGLLLGGISILGFVAAGVAGALIPENSDCAIPNGPRSHDFHPDPAERATLRIPVRKKAISQAQGATISSTRLRLSDCPSITSI